MRSVATLVALSLMAGGSAVATAKRDLNEVPAARSLGPAVNCVSLTQLRESRVRNDRVIDFRVSGKKWYRNTLPQNCPSLGFEERFSYRTSLTQLCSTDIITVLYSGGGGLQPGASCGLGKFEPVEIEKKVATR